MFGVKTKQISNTKYNNKEAYLFLLPWLIGVAAFTIWPMIQSLGLSFTDYSIYGNTKFIGLDNYKEMFFDDRMFKTSLVTTLLYVLMFVPVKTIAALLVAKLLNKKIRGMAIYRTIYYIPSIIGAGVAMAVTWKILLSRDGFVNQLLSHMGLGPFDFLTSPDMALGTLAMMGAWQFGSAMVVFLAALKQVPKDLYEAADIDGANKVRQFFSITLPMISSTILFNLIMGIINAFQVFTQVSVITNGGPADSTYVYMLHLYRTAFESHRMGYSSALAWILTLIILAVTLLIFGSSQKWVYYEN
ncbi:carbohydrate ABC transporter permease [Anaerocolumna sp.]|uniref:carbohydrate ABC transporter permease n=1 Tax=Anaerocolumna sp. TaxID=2041569 RepID=UPI0028ADE4EB|nr:sugar ABC transporter permease [Anaerocolumna sp.]